MDNKYVKLLLLAFLLSFPSESFAQFVNTSNYWNCSNRTGGTWTFGHAPSACSVNPFIGSDYVKSKFSPYIFDDSANRAGERERYMSEMHNLVIKASEYYIKRRKPSVSATEVKYFNEAILAITHQESFMTHYRDGSILRMMRGDFGHGHGLMQIDDRWHFANVKDGNAAHLIKNLFYALDIYYEAWQLAPSKNCVPSSTAYYTRSRAAYSAYNGGLDDICRFRNPGHSFARNDSNFKDKLDTKAWSRYINAVSPTPVNIACLANTTSANCSTTNPNPTPPNEPPVSTSFFAVGELIQLLKNINVRQTPGGKRVATFKAGESFQVLDRSLTNGARYYLIQKNNIKGYVYAGTEATHSQWVKEGRDAILYLPVIGSEITVLTRSGTNLRITPGGTRLTTIPNGTRLSVLSVQVTSGLKELYVKVKYGNQTGYLYSGTLAPRYTVSNWISIR